MQAMHWTMAGCLWLGFFLTFYHFGRLRALRRLLQKTRSSMEDAARKRLLSARSNLSRLQREEGVWFFLERQLCHSGLKRRFPFLGAEGFVLASVLAGTVLFVLGSLLGGIFWGCVCMGMLAMLEVLAITLGKAMEMRAVNENLMKFLDFLGNYGVMAGDVISVFEQIGKFMDEPIRSALEECCVEAQTTGDVGMALLSMADKIEHPQFQELLRNIEVSSRYSADFVTLVNFSRRSMREYLRSNRERKSLLREASINMLLLLGMSAFALVTVNGLLDADVWAMLVETIVGRIALGVVATILLLFGMQIYRLEG